MKNGWRDKICLTLLTESGRAVHSGNIATSTSTRLTEHGEDRGVSGGVKNKFQLAVLTSLWCSKKIQPVSHYILKGRQTWMETWSRPTPKWKDTLSCVQLFVTPWLYLPWNTPEQNIGVGSLSPLQGIFPTQESNSRIADRFFTSWVKREA